MIHASGNNANRRLYLDDLHVGQRFVRDAHALDAPDNSCVERGYTVGTSPSGGKSCCHAANALLNLA
jgi:hypothetical protein